MTSSLDLKLGPANDVVKILIDGKLVRVRDKKVHRDCRAARHGHSVGRNCTIHARRDDRTRTGTTWEDSYRFDPEQVGSGNTIPTTAKLSFRESGNATLGNVGQGFLIDDVAPCPAMRVTKRDCRHDGWTAAGDCTSWPAVPYCKGE